MFENEAKGWYGSYSIVGRDMVERFQIIKNMDKILSNKEKKIIIKNYFTKEEESFSKKEDKGKAVIDIFSSNYDNNNTKTPSDKRKNFSKKIQRLNICDSLSNTNFKENYKYHQIHHNEFNMPDYKLKLKLKNKMNFIDSYSPKYEIIRKRVITGPNWNLLGSRWKDNIKTSNPIDKDKKNFIEKTKNDIIMNRQLRRATLPLFYDVRIRTNKPFNSEIKNNLESKYYKTQTNFRKKNVSIGKIKDFSTNKENRPMDLKCFPLMKKIPRKKRNFDWIKRESLNKTIDFSKVLPRKSNIFLPKSLGNEACLLFHPNYKFVEPRIITMVSYSRDSKKKTKKRKFSGINSILLANLQNGFNNIKKAKEINAPNFKIMSGREYDDSPLPFYMINVFDRRSVDMINSKALKMNGYAYSEFPQNFSTFKMKKSFNSIINNSILNQNKDIISEQMELFNGGYKDNSEDKKWKKLIKKYFKEDDKINNNQNFDAFTLKTIQKTEKRKKYKNKHFFI